ncbi:hypothetical protein AAG570_005243, partial [Ranatra chinensis]
KRYSYWTSLGIKQASGIVPFFGNTLEVATSRISLGQFYMNLYFAFPEEPAVGYYDLVRPVIVVRDPGLVEKVLVKDFSHFVDRTAPGAVDEEANPTDLGLVSLTGNRWRRVRQKLVPTFTAAKLKRMFPQMAACSTNMLAWVGKLDDRDVDIRQALALYSTDVIGSCVFGIDLGHNPDPDSEFRRMSRDLFGLSTKQMIKLLIITNLPRLAKKLKLSFANQKSVEYFSAIVRKAFEDHEKDPGLAEGRKDFLHLLSELKRKGVVQVASKELDEEDEYLKMDGGSAPADKFELTDDLLFAQAFQFLTAGLEGTSLAAMYLVHELASNQDVQDKLRAEIEEVSQEYNGQITYDAIRKMTYLNMCLSEAARKYPTAMMLFRICQKDYKAEELGGAVIEAGTQVIVPVWALHYDPNYFPQPEVFRPERFAEDEEAARPKCVYLPFGDGPRMCIGKWSHWEESYSYLGPSSPAQCPYSPLVTISTLWAILLRTLGPFH